MNISIEDLITVSFSSFGILFCLYVSIQVMFLKKDGNKRTNNILGGLLILHSLTLLNSLLSLTGITSTYQNLYFLPLTFSLWIGPLYYFFIRTKINPGMEINLRELKHFIIPFIQFSFYLVISFKTVEEKSWIWRNLISTHVQYLEESLVIFLGLYYLFHSLKIINQTITNTIYVKSTVKWLKRFTYTLLILLSINSFYEILDWILWGKYGFNLFNYDWLSFPLKISYGAISFVIGYNSILYNNQHLIIPQIVKDINTEKIEEEIITLINDEKIFLNPDLNLEVFSKIVGYHRNTISKVLNQNGIGFVKTINELRLRKFLSLCEKGELEDKTILGLAMESGFNSKSSFNRIFKEYYNDSPSNYIHKNFR